MTCFTCVWWNYPVWWWSPDEKACTWPPPSPAWSNSHGRSQEETGAQVVATNRGAPQVSRALSDLHFQPLWPTSQPTVPHTPTNYILSSAYTPSCYRRPSKRTTSGLQTRNPWQTSRSASLRSMTFKSTSSTKRLNDKPSLLVDPQMTSSHQWLWSIKVQQINKI